MPLQIEQYQHGGITVLRIAKILRGESDAAYLLVILDQLIASEKNQILLNLRELTSIDTVGLNALVEGHTKVKAAGGVIKLVNAAERHTDLFILSEIAPLFPNFNDEDVAIKSFASDSGEDVKHFDILEFVREINQENDEGKTK